MSRFYKKNILKVHRLLRGYKVKAEDYRERVSELKAEFCRVSIQYAQAIIALDEYSGFDYDHYMLLNSEVNEREIIIREIQVALKFNIEKLSAINRRRKILLRELLVDVNNEHLDSSDDDSRFQKWNRLTVWVMMGSSTTASSR